MKKSKITLIPLCDTFTIYQLENNGLIPSEIYNSEFYSITRTENEISIITSSNADFKKLKANRGWKGFKVDGTLDFSLIGILNRITEPLKAKWNKYFCYFYL